MIKELSTVKWSIVGLDETIVKESSVTIPEEGHKLFLCRNGNNKANGTGFLVYISLVHSFKEYHGFRDKFLSIVLQLAARKLHLLQVYFPTTSADESEVAILYDQIQQLMDPVPKRYSLFIMGDFNAKVGGLNRTHPNSVGKCTLGNFNERGLALANFCTRNNLLLINSIFMKSHKNLWTWLSPGGNYRNQMDFIITRTKDKQCIHDSTTPKLNWTLRH